MRRVKTKLNQISVLVVALIVSISLAACGDNTATTAPAATTAAATTAAATTAATATTAAAATTASGSATTAATASGSVWLNPPGQVPANIKGGPGVDLANKTITVASITDMTGPASNGGQLAFRSLTTFFKGLNDRGGIDGFKIIYNNYDSQYSPQVATQAYNKAIDNTAMFSFILGTPIVGALQPQIDQDKVFSIAASYASKWVKDPNMLVGGTTYRVELLNLVDYLVNKMGKKNPKMAFVYQDDALGADIAAAYDVAIKTYGVQDMGRFGYKATDKDFTGQATALKNSGADYVFVGGLYNQAQQVISTASSLGYNPTYLMNVIAWDASIFNTGAKDAIKGALIPYNAPSWTSTNVPMITQMNEDIKKYLPNEPESSGFTTDYFDGIITQAVLKKAIESGDLSREGILKAANSLQNVDVLGYIPPMTIGTDPNQRLISRAIKIGTPDASAPSKLKLLTDEFYMGEAAKNYDFATAP